MGKQTVLAALFIRTICLTHHCSIGLLRDTKKTSIVKFQQYMLVSSVAKIRSRKRSMTHLRPPTLKIETFIVATRTNNAWLKSVLCHRKRLLQPARDKWTLWAQENSISACLMINFRKMSSRRRMKTMKLRLSHSTDRLNNRRDQL